MKITKKQALKIYYLMKKIRIFEEKIVSLYPQQEMRTPVHLYIGEEAIAVGVCVCLEKDDVVFGTHRSHGVYIAKGGNIKELASELYGKQTGCSRGKGGSMHVIDLRCGVFGTTAIVGGNIPLGVGAGLGFKLKGEKRVSCIFFGDGGVDQGTFYESINFAVLKRLPVLFICENNFFATHSHISKRQPLDNIYERGMPLGIPSFRVDGNDVLAVYFKVKEVIDQVRFLNIPVLIECRTFRWMSHVGPQSDEELGTPPAKYLKEWKDRCPIEKWESYIIENNIATKRDLDKITEKIDKEVEEAFIYAKNSPYPPCEDVYKDVFK